MPAYFVSPEGSGDGLSESSPITLERAAEIVTPGCLFTLLPGIYLGAAFYGRDEYLASYNPIRFEFRPGAKIRGGTVSRGHGLTISGFNGVDIIDADIADIRAAQNGCGLWLDGCKKVLIDRCMIDNADKWGIHLPHCHDVTIRNGVISRSRREHGIYVANSASRVLIQSMQLIANSDCGIQSNGDDTNPAPFPSLTKAGSIIDLTIEDCIFAYNGAGGGADWNADSVVGAIYRRNIHIPGRGKGNVIAVFNSDYNPNPTQNVLIEDNIIFAGPEKYNIFACGTGDLHNGQYGSHQRLPTNITVRNNVLVHRRTPGSMMELWLPAPLVNFLMEGNQISTTNAVTQTDSNTSISSVGVTGQNTLLSETEIQEIESTLPAIPDPGLGTIPSVPGPPPPTLPSLPDSAPLATPADPTLVDQIEQGSLWLREWHAVDRFGADYDYQALNSPYTFDGYISPLGQHQRYDPGFGLRWQGFIRPDKSGVYEFALGSNQLHDASLAGEQVSSGGDNSHTPTVGKKIVQLEAGKFYTFEYGVMTNGGYITNVLMYRRFDAQGSYTNIPELWLFPPENRPGVPVPTPTTTTPPPDDEPSIDPPPGPTPVTQGIVIDTLPKLLDVIKAVRGPTQ